ncbi:hypothetical protein HID58_087681, partial [Brassica napus]
SDILVPCCVVVSYGVKLLLIGFGQSLVVIDVVFLVAGLPSIVSARLGSQDLVFGWIHGSLISFCLILSLFISLFSHLVAPFIADHVYGGSPFRHICYSRILWFFAVMGVF